MSAPSARLRRRRRQTLSCTECRRRKLKCDRSDPCDRCAKSGSVHLCRFVAYDGPAAAASKPQGRIVEVRDSEAQSSNPSPTTIAQPQEQQQQQQQQQHQQQQHQQQQHQPPPPPMASSNSRRIGQYPSPADSTARTDSRSELPSQATSDVVNNFSNNQDDRLSRNDGLSSLEPMNNLWHGANLETQLFGRSHWSATIRQFDDVISTIAASKHNKDHETVKEYSRMKKTRKQTRQSNAHDECHRSVLMDAFIPPRDVVDVLVNCYLETFEYTHRILHVPTFKQGYVDFWTAPLKENEAFFAKLLIVMSIGCFHRDARSIRLIEEMVPQNLASTWLHAAQHWLDSAMAKGKGYFEAAQVHALLLLGRQVTSEDANLIWISSGSLVRTAIVLGLNRDPSSLASMTPFAAEMRRRLWATIVEIDLQASLDAGKPLAISFDDCDCYGPSNIADEDMAETDQTFPTPRPTEIFTRTSFQVAMHHSLQTRVEIARLANSCHLNVPYNKLLSIAAQLTKALSDPPPFFRLDRTTSSRGHHVTDFPNSLFHLATRRFLLALHRPVSILGAYDPMYHFSRTTCFDASLKILSLLSLNSEAIGQLSDGPPTVFADTGGMHRNELFHAALTVCLELLMGIVDFEKLGCSIQGPALSIAPGTNGRQNFERYLTMIENFVLMMETWSMNESDHHKKYLFLSMVVTAVKARSLQGNVDEAVWSRLHTSIRMCRSLLLIQPGQDAPAIPTFLDSISPQDDGNWEGNLGIDFGYYPGLCT